MFVTAFAVLALALSAVGAPVSQKDTTDPQHAQTHDVATTKNPKQDGVTNVNGALTITSPAVNAVWIAGQQNVITWTTDGLKEKTGSFFLEKAGSEPNQGVSLASDVPLGQGSVKVTATADPGAYYVALMVDGANVAKSAQFTIKSSEGKTSTTKDSTPKTKDTTSGSKNADTNGGKATGTTPQNTDTNTPQGKN